MFGWELLEQLSMKGEAKGSGNSLLLNLTESHRFYESSAFSL